MQIRIKNISYVFDQGGVTEHKAVDNVSLEINQGEFITVIGQTGSGKTTFIEHLNGLLRPTVGELNFISKPLAESIKKNQKLMKKGRRISDTAFIITPSRRKIKDLKLLRKHVGIVFQFAEYQLFEETIEKDIIFGPVSMGVEKEEARQLARKYINLVGLDEKYLSRSPFALSGGQKRRVALAGILAMEPEILVFDEPTAGLDPQGEKDMYDIFTRLHKQGKTIIIVTHNLDHVLQYSSRTIVFNDSKLVRDGKTIEIMYDLDFLFQNNLEPPKLVDLVKRIEDKNVKIGKVTSIEELAKKASKG